MNEPLDPVFASTFMYSACKVVGADLWDRYRTLTLSSIDDLDGSDWAGFRTFGQLARVCQFYAYVDASTYIDRARCVAAGHFLARREDVWLTVDDDIDADEEVLRKAILLCRATRGGVAVPYMNRDGKSMTFRKVRGPTYHAMLNEEISESAAWRFVDRVGFGLVALHRQLVETLAGYVPSFRESESSAVRCPALFRNGVESDTWVGEDYSFSKLAEDAGHPLRVLLDVPVSHAGLEAKLDLEGHIRVADPERARVLDAAIRAKEAAACPSPCSPPQSQGE